jgi:FlaG/FlaF family flagellin (archaellin)
MNVNTAPNAWIRLFDFAIGNMNDFRDDETIRFSDAAVFDFLVKDGQEFTITANGWDGGVGDTHTPIIKDCLDEHFGHHEFKAHVNWDTPM